MEIETPIPETTVVNLREERHDIYIGRGSPSGNPFSYLPKSQALVRVATRAECMSHYVDYFLGEPWVFEKWPQLKPLHVRALEQLPKMVGKRLGCFCKPLECHGDIQAEIVNLLTKQDRWEEFKGLGAADRRFLVITFAWLFKVNK